MVVLFARVKWGKTGQNRTKQGEMERYSKSLKEMGRCTMRGHYNEGNIRGR
jgi:hypothetical protein